MNDSKKRVVLVGPVYPYKGGISHYTSLMCRALSENYLVEMVSYRLQYPRFLFRKEQKDYSNDSFKIKRTKYWINTMAPWNWIECSKKIKQLKPDLIIIQWWHPYFTPCYLALACLLKRCRILFVCHNVLPHEHFPGDRFFNPNGTVQRKRVYCPVKERCSGFASDDSGGSVSSDRPSHL